MMKKHFVFISARNTLKQISSYLVETATMVYLDQSMNQNDL